MRRSMQMPWSESYSIVFTSIRSRARDLFCWLRRAQSGKVKNKKCKIGVYNDSSIARQNALSARPVERFRKCGFSYFRARICFQSRDFAWPADLQVFFFAPKTSIKMSGTGVDWDEKAGSSLRCSFLTKPRQLIKFDLIVLISRESPGADA